MRLLAIDTSSNLCSVCICKQGQSGKSEYFYNETNQQSSHSQALAQSVEKLLDEAGLLATDIDVALIGSGPGSFTGLRIGFGFVKGLSFALKLPVAVISTFHAIAACLVTKAELICVVGDAHKAGFFMGLYKRKDNGVSEVLREPGLVTAHELAQTINKYSADNLGIVLNAVNESAVLNAVDSVGRTTQQAHLISKGLIELFWHLDVGSRPGAFSLDRLVSIEPTYVQKVAAKTILERGVDALVKNT